MASKSRGGLSKNEVRKLASQAKPKASTRSVASKAPVYKSIASAPSIDAYNKGIGATTPKLTSAQQTNQASLNKQYFASSDKSNTKSKIASSGSSKSSSSNRALAAKALPKSESLFGGGEILADTSNAVGRFARGKVSTLQQGLRGWRDIGKRVVGGLAGDDSIFGGVGKSLGDNSLRDLGGLGFTDEDRQRNRQMAYDNTIGIPTTNASNGSDMPQSILDQAPFNPSRVTRDPNASESLLRSDFATPGTDFSRPGSEERYMRGEDPRYTDGTLLGDSSPRRSTVNPFRIPVAQANDDYINMPEDLNDDQKSARRQYGDIGVDPSLQQEMYSQSQNELFGGGPGPADMPGFTQGNRSGRGAGMFATGKGLQGGDPVLDLLRKSMKGYGKQERSVENQFEDLIKALDPTYEEYQNDAKKGIDEELNQNLIKLASVMNANNTGDSEQRAQMMSRQQSDATARLADLIRKLQLDKQEQITGYKTKAVDAVNSIRDKKMSAQERLAQLLQQRDDTAWDREYKMQQLGQKGSKTAAPKNMSLKAIGFDKFGTETRWVDQATGDIYENDDF